MPNNQSENFNMIKPQPENSSFLPQKEELWICERRKNYVLIIRKQKENPTKMITVGKNPWKILFTKCGEFAAVLNWADRTVTIIKTEKYEVIKTATFDNTPSTIRKTAEDVEAIDCYGKVTFKVKIN